MFLEDGEMPWDALTFITGEVTYEYFNDEVTKLIQLTLEILNQPDCHVHVL